MLIMVTNTQKIYGIDLRTMNEMWTLQSPKEYGEITAVVFHKRNRWLLKGTSRGALVLWDTRFKILLRQWIHPARTRINKLSSLVKDSSRLVAISSDSEVSLWDISKLECLQIWRIFQSSAIQGQSTEDIMKSLYSNGFKVSL